MPSIYFINLSFIFLFIFYILIHLLIFNLKAQSPFPCPLYILYELVAFHLCHFAITFSLSLTHKYLILCFHKRYLFLSFFCVFVRLIFSFFCSPVSASWPDQVVASSVPPSWNVKCYIRPPYHLVPDRQLGTCVPPLGSFHPGLPSPPTSACWTRSAPPARPAPPCRRAGTRPQPSWSSRWSRSASAACSTTPCPRPCWSHAPTCRWGTHLKVLRLSQC